MDGDRRTNWLGVRDAAKRLGVHENTIRNWAKTGVLPARQVPGSRFLRFDPLDVEQLQRSRRALPAASATHGRTFGPELVDANQLNQWAETVDARSVFPQVVRRLLAASPGVTEVSVRSGEGVGLPGWDGRARTRGTSFLPDGDLRIEIGVGKDPKKKANEDYSKRLADAKEDPAGLVFVFITPRRWPSAAGWADERRQEGRFKDVHVLDADDIEGWLEKTPAVHYWLSELLGRRPSHAQTLARWWSRFSHRTEPALPVELFVAGRRAESEDLARLLRGSPQYVALKSSSQDDALAFIASALTLADDPDAPALLDRALVVSSVDSWHRLSHETVPSILIPTFPEPVLREAIDAGHHVVQPIGSDQAVSGAAIALPRLSRREASEALRSAGLGFEKAERLAALGRRSMPALLRRLSRDQAVLRPPWAQGTNAAIVAPLTLVQSWSEAQGDTDLVADIAEAQWAEISRVLHGLRDTADPPFIRRGSEWHVASPEESIVLLEPAIPKAALNNWHDVATKVLLEEDPLTDLDAVERLTAHWSGTGRIHSPVIRRGFANSVALLGSSADLGLQENLAFSNAARSVVARVLETAINEDTGRVWRMLSPDLPLLSEGAPQEFLDAVERGLEGDPPVLASLFCDQEDVSLLSANSLHTGLLWALETLCWSGVYFIDATFLLARLASIDPGGRLSNRPLESLKNVFVGWIRHTSASTEVRLAAIRQIAAEMPSVAWDLVTGLLPTHHAVALPPASPKFRDWKPDREAVPLGEWAEYVSALVDEARRLAGEDAGRWTALLETLSALPQESQQKLIDSLGQFAARSDLAETARRHLWNGLRETISRHRAFPDADWALSEEVLKSLEGVAASIEPMEVERFAYLFGWHANIFEADRSDFATYDRIVSEKRTQALELALQEGDGALERLLSESAAPEIFGASLAAVDPNGDRSAVLLWLSDPDPRRREAAGAWAGVTLREGDKLGRLLQRPEVIDDDARLTLALRAPATADTWDLLDELEGVGAKYWATATPWLEASEDVPRAVRRLLAEARPWPAVQVLAAAVHHFDASRIDPLLAADALDQAVDGDPSDIRGHPAGYEVGQLIDFLERSNWPIQNLAQYEFAYYRLLEDYRRPRALAQELNARPELFVDLVRRVYRGKHESARELSERESALARHAWHVLHNWSRPPGFSDDGVDIRHLNEWVSAARLALTDADRTEVGDELIGEILASSPVGDDGAWPAEPIRDLVEAIGSPRLENGLFVGRLNRRGPTVRDPYEGGGQERQLAEQYRSWADITSRRWRRTTRLLRAIADSYERDAAREDERAELSGDTD